MRRTYSKRMTVAACATFRDSASPGIGMFRPREFSSSATPVASQPRMIALRSKRSGSRKTLPPLAGSVR